MLIRMVAAAAAWFFLVLPAQAFDDPFTPTWTEIAPGVWTGIRDDSPRTPVMGNTTLVVSDEGVVVFDGGAMPLWSERVVEKIKSITDKPVTHVIVSHWHGDHDYGISRILEAYPGAQVISHAYTRASLAKNIFDPSFKEQFVPYLEKTIAARTFANGQPMSDADVARFQDTLDHIDLIEAQIIAAKLTFPSVTFEGALTIWSGGREIRLLHLGLSNTAGDIVMWLPKEKIVATGDIVVRPTPYGFGSYPGEWAKAIGKIKALDYAILIPGHGDLQRDAAYLDLLIETFQSIESQMAALVAEGLSLEDAKARLDFSSLEPRFTGGNTFLGRIFQIWFKDPIAEAAYKVAKGENPELPDPPAE